MTINETIKVLQYYNADNYDCDNCPVAKFCCQSNIDEYTCDSIMLKSVAKAVEEEMEEVL